MPDAKGEHTALGPALVVVVIVVAALVAVLAYLAERKRTQEIQRWAASRGLDFNPSRVEGFDARYPGFEPLQRGSRRYACNLAQGNFGALPVVAFDWHYETYSTHKGRRRTHHHWFSAVMVASPIPLERLTIRPEGLFDKLKSVFGFDDIDFESAEFSRSFHVQAPRKKWAFDVLHARAIEFLMASPRFHLEFEGDAVLAAGNRRLGAAELEAAIGVAGGLLDALPAWLVKERVRPEGTA